MNSILDRFYDTLLPENLGNRVDIPHSTVFYARAAIREATGIELDPYVVEQLLYEEGLLPASEYGIPAWYRKKYQVR